MLNLFNCGGFLRLLGIDPATDEFAAAAGEIAGEFGELIVMPAAEGDVAFDAGDAAGEITLGDWAGG